METKEVKPNWALLAGLRFVLAAIVACAHTYILVPNGVENGHWLPKFGLAVGPFTSVAGFFILSGYSIAASLDRDPDVKRFYARRVNRLAPAYYCALLFALAVHGFCGAYISNLQESATAPPALLLVPYLFMVGSLFGGFTLLVQTWSLTMEVIYYAIAPLLRKIHPNWVWGIIVASGIFYLVTPHVGWGYYPTGAWWVVPAVFWLWLLGWQLYREGSKPYTFPACCLLAWLLVSINNMSPGVYSAIPLIVTLIAIQYGGNVRLGETARRRLNYLGDLSYPLYVVHLAVFYLVYDKVTWFDDNEILLIALSGSMALSVAIHGVEILVRKRRVTRLPHSGTPELRANPQ